MKKSKMTLRITRQIRYINFSLFALNKVNILIRIDIINKLLTIKILNPLIFLGGLNLRRRIDHILILNSFAIDPRICIIKLEHI